MAVVATFCLYVSIESNTMSCLYSLPCGVAAQTGSIDESVARTLPIPSDAILPEHDTESMQKFITLTIKVLRRQFPRLPEDRDTSMGVQDTTAVASDSCTNNGCGDEDSSRAQAVDMKKSRRRSRNRTDNEKCVKAEAWPITRVRIERSWGNRDGTDDARISKS